MNTLTKMLRGARRLVRRTLGLEHFEELMLNEVRSDRAEMTVLRREVERLDRHISDTRSQTYALQARNAGLNMLKREVEELGLLLRQHTDAHGSRTDWRTDWCGGRVTNDHRAMPPQLSVHPDTLERVRNVLPLWAQNIVTDLRTRRLSKVSKQNRERMQTLPLWAQDLIDDLVRRAKR